ncbi:MAG: hypothetical protein ABIK15_14090 [Pseudomonadota bacterium]
MQIKFLLYMVLLTTALILGSCSDDAPNQKIVSRINNYELTLDEFQNQLAQELELDEDFKLTNATRMQFLEELIRKELLIQEAKRQKLDQQKQFIGTIERYWESTLIRNLIDLKSEEIHNKVVVSEEEIQFRYETMKKKNPSLPAFDLMRKELEQKIKEEKKSGLLQKWLTGLRESADIKIDSSLL